MLAENRNNVYFEKLFLLFILIQPIIDLITGITLRLTESQLSLSLVVRTIFLLFAGCYLLFYKGHPFRQKQLIYFLLLAVFLVVHLGVNYYMKPQFYLISEIKFISKALFFVVTLSLYMVIFKNSHVEWREKAIQYIVFAMTMYSSVIFVAGITNTSFPSYEWEKVGSVGWFNSGNEIGAMLAVGFPIVVLTAIKKSGLYWLPVILMVYSLFAIGTKVGYMTIILVLGIALLFSLVEYFLKIDRVKKQLVSAGILTLILAGTVIYTPFSPIAQNMGIHLAILDDQSQGTDKIPKNTQLTDEAQIESERMQNLVLSGRDVYLEMYKEYFDEAPIAQKLFGMGYGGNYELQPKMIEMDFHDLFYSFGIVGMLILCSPILYCIIIILYNGIRNFKDCFNIENILLASSCALGFGIALVAGHVLTAPGVSFYLAVIVAYLTVKVEQTSFRKY